MTFIEAIHEAQKEAFKCGVRANAIFINKNFAVTQPFVLSFLNHAQLLKPMILGMKAEITDELPEEVGFILAEIEREQLMTGQEKEIRMDMAKEIFYKLIEVAADNQGCLPIGILKAWALEYDVEVDND